MDNDVSNYRVEEQLKNGEPITIRAIRPEDKGKIITAFENLERESIYTRLFSFKKELNEGDLRRITEVDFDQEVALVVTHMVGNDEIIIGSGRYVMTGETGEGPQAEVAFLVEEDFHGLGMAKTILRHLTAIARSRGIAAFEAEVLPGNKAMLTAFARSGLPMEQRYSSDTVHITLRL
jgi:GNAT superfamily N-acetyltransferase